MFSIGKIPSLKIKRFLFLLSDRRALPVSGVIFLLLIFIFGILYWFLTPVGHGVMEGSEIPQNFNFFNGIYFSIVTISSLGYGDLRPVGFSKILVSLEVVLGLSLIGIMIATLTSRRISYLVSRLFVSDARKRLQAFAICFDDHKKQFQALLPSISQVYQATPGEHREDADTNVISTEFGNCTREMAARSSSVHDYFSDEANEGGISILFPFLIFWKCLFQYTRLYLC